MATLTILTNDSNDIFLPDGKNISIISNGKALAQNIKHSHLMRKGEDLYDINNGVDYLGTIFTTPVDLDAARQSLSLAILKHKDVKNIESLSVNVEGNEFSFDAEISTSYGELLRIKSNV